MKVAIIGDLHFGVRSGNEDFFSFQCNYIDHFIDECVAKGVEVIVNPGDFFDVRKSMNIRVLDYVRTRFAKKVQESGIKWYFVPGNHDTYFKHTNAITAMRAFDGLPLIKVFEEPITLLFAGGRKVLMMPWLDDNLSQNLETYIKNSGADYMFGHLELAGFPMYANNVAEHGLSIDTFKQFKQVWTGHYHTISQRQNIQYIGSPYHLTWGDVPDDVNRGWFLWDTETDTYELQKNEPWMSMFGVHVYDPLVDENTQTLTDKIGNKIIKVLVREKPNEKHFKTFVKVLNSVPLIEYRIIDETVVQSTPVQIKEVDLLLDTSVVFGRYIDGQEDGLFDKSSLKNLMNEILTRAQQEA